jgi:3-methyladenine DNA glycosylase Tag
MPYEIPPRERPRSDNGYLEQMTKSVFQAGFSWKVIRDKWPGFQRAFDGFDIDGVAGYHTHDIDRLLADESIVRNGRKIEATIHNARVMRRLIDEHGSFFDYLRSLDHLDYPARRQELRQRFKHLGPTGIFTFLWSVDEEVPNWEDRDK